MKTDVVGVVQSSLDEISAIVERLAQFLNGLSGALSFFGDALIIKFKFLLSGSRLLIIRSCTLYFLVNKSISLLYSFCFSAF